MAGTDTSSVTGALTLYNELLLGGKRPDVEEFCARYHNEPDLARRIRALSKLRSDLEQAVRAPNGFIDGPPKAPGYDIIRELGQGGMGQVFLARKRGTNGFCALKFVFNTSLQRFAREVQLFSALNHRGIAGLIDHGLVDDVPYLVTELVHGFSLKELLASIDSNDFARRNARLRRRLEFLTPATRLQELAEDPGLVSVMTYITTEIATALAYAHQRDVIHRDIKPGNIMIGFDGRVKLIDFGLAVGVSDDAHKITRTGVFLGTMSYAAPEQLRADRDAIGSWSDVYSFGVTFYEMLTGSRPYDVNNMYERIAAPGLGPKSLLPRLSTAINAIVLRCLAPEPLNRFRDGSSVANAIRNASRRKSSQPLVQVMESDEWKEISSDRWARGAASGEEAAESLEPEPIFTESVASKLGFQVLVALLGFALVMALGLFWEVIF